MLILKTMHETILCEEVLARWSFSTHWAAGGFHVGPLTPIRSRLQPDHLSADGVVTLDRLLRTLPKNERLSRMKGTQKHWEMVAALECALAMLNTG